jgi:hypothetical protein
MTSALVAAVALALGAAPMQGTKEYRHASADGVQALLSYAQADGVVRDARLKITRRRAVRIDAPVRALTRFSQPVGLVVRDLDGDGEPEVILDVYTGGAHCCTHSLIYRYDAGDHRYRLGVHDWGNVGYHIVDLDRNGRPEFRSADDRFAYAFTSFAASVFPVRVWRFDRGLLFDVTRHFPALVAGDARSNWHLYLRYRQERSDVRGVLAAWLADEYLLGRAEEGWRRLKGLSREHALGPGAAAYLKALRSFLQRLEYPRG